ncbi:MAG: glutamate 5-kinase, partial [Clostridia bacterium]|nr:glutamate 5-kinase [Clostridia bacterium]
MIAPFPRRNSEITCPSRLQSADAGTNTADTVLCHADIVINLTDIDGYYDSDPRKNPYAKMIPYVESVTDEMVENAGGAGTERGTGGMQAKLIAAQMLADAGIPMMIVQGT